MKKLFRLIYTLTYFVSLLPLKVYDLCHGTEFSGMEHNKDTDGRYSYSPSSLFSFPQIKRYIRRYLSNGHGHGILDIGCGKGFVLHFFSSFDFDTVSGIEYNDDLCRTARRNLSCGTKYIAVYHGDATKFLRYADYDTFYRAVFHSANIVKQIDGNGCHGSYSDEDKLHLLLRQSSCESKHASNNAANKQNYPSPSADLRLEAFFLSVE